MSLSQSGVSGNVISFALHVARAQATAHGACLTPTDRIVISNWRDRASSAGFDRMIVHDRDENDACEVGNFLSVYRCGQAWSRWGFARNGSRIDAWCCLTGADVGSFASLPEALEQVLDGAAAGHSATPPVALTNLIPLRRTLAKQVGSAA